MPEQEVWTFVTEGAFFDHSEKSDAICPESIIVSTVASQDSQMRRASVLSLNGSVR